ncbi:MAG TPA: hypothetical protein VF711_09540, partial [Acidimicrobiales bacterium]
MIVAAAVLCGLLGVVVGIFANRVIDRWCTPGETARYMLVEVVIAGLFAGTVFRFGADAVIPAYLVFFTSLVAVSTIDLDLRIIPNRIIYPTIFASIPLL